jgi:hypothetical protein
MKESKQQSERGVKDEEMGSCGEEEEGGGGGAGGGDGRGAKQSSTHTCNGIVLCCLQTATTAGDVASRAGPAASRGRSAHAY